MRFGRAKRTNSLSASRFSDKVRGEGRMPAADYIFNMMSRRYLSPLAFLQS